MLVVLVVACLCIVRGDALPTKNLTWITCKDVSVEVDGTLPNVNADVKRNGDDNMSVDIPGFTTEVGVYLWGLRLPLTVSLTAALGNLTGADTMVRISPAVGCATFVNDALEGDFTYGPAFSLSYESSKAKFNFPLLSREVHGTFVFKPKLKMSVYLLNDTVSITRNCRMESMSLEVMAPSEYVFETENTFTGWLISKLIFRGMQQNDDTSLLERAKLWAQAEVGNYFVQQWCDPDFQLDNE